MIYRQLNYPIFSEINQSEKRVRNKSPPHPVINDATTYVVDLFLGHTGHVHEYLFVTAFLYQGLQ